ncbi:putative bifunctional diguanylate cyclase/phosphodiesterase [Nakamurella sp.]|uniref:putative bifunctional diguanylate cyclase/phosphodiesterase n=1 Tax=Nakamurella sp. TaxID=1869182 RepID=UPI003784D7D9
MGVTAPTMHADVQQLLRLLVEYFGVDNSFLRRNDHVKHATILVAEWPPRDNVPDPDPLGVVEFKGAEPTFAASEHLTSVVIIRPGTFDAAPIDDTEYQDRIRRASGVEGGVSLAVVPLLGVEQTMGILGFVKHGDREWDVAEINALRAVAGLLAQLQARIAAEERLRYLAYHDELTDVANRRSLIDHLTERLQPEQPGPVGLIFMDVDRLKALNSFFGHAAGDQYLQTLANRLHDRTDPIHLLARLGGDEFVLVMAGSTDEATARAKAEELRAIANESILVGGEEVSRAVSIGVALGYPGLSTASEVMDQADQAMLEAKSRGGNEISLFSAQMRQANEIRTDIELHIGSAIRDGSLVLNYQPEVDLRNGRILGVEALVRWPHPTLGLLQPSAFIDVVEATNLAGELGRWVLGQACRQQHLWQQRFPDHPLNMAVNISPAQLITLDFVATVARVLDEHQVDGHRLTLEITEQALVRDTDQALATLRGLQQIGVRVAIDDFGTGYSSFAQLKTLPVDTLKIDKGFILQLGANPDDLAIVRSIIGLAGSLGMELVAEGVETEIAASMLVDLGCTHAQGFLFAGPRPPADIELILAAGGCPPKAGPGCPPGVDGPAAGPRTTSGYGDLTAPPTRNGRRFRPAEP